MVPSMGGSGYGAEQAERLALAAEASGTVLIDWDIESGAILRFGDPSALAALGLQRDDTTESWAGRIHPEDRPRVLAHRQHCLESSEARWTDEFRLLRAEGSYAWVSVRAAVVRRPDGTAERLVGVGRDVSDRREAEEDRRRMASEFIRMSQVHAMTAAAATLAHELNQPLMAAANYLAVGRRALAEIPGGAAREAEGELADAEGQIRRAGDIIRRIRLLIGRRQPAASREASLSAASRSLPQLLGTSEACARARIAFRLDPAADRVQADPVQLEQILLNLVRNACEAAAAVPEPEVTVRSRRADGTSVEVEVSDNGPGIADELLPFLLDSVDASSRAGLGLGLPMARAIVEALGGRLRAHNNTGSGASFVFTLLLATEEKRPGYELEPDPC